MSSQSTPSGYYGSREELENSLNSVSENNKPIIKKHEVTEVTDRPVAEGGKLGQYWKIACAIVYLSICIFDFLIMPVIVTNYSRDIDHSAIFLEISKLENAQAQVALINKIDYNIQTWEPISLNGGGMLHIAFGAILAGAAIRPLHEKISVTRTQF